MRTTFRLPTLALLSLLLVWGCGGGKNKTGVAGPVAESTVKPAPGPEAPPTGETPPKNVEVEVPPIPAKNTKGWASGKLDAVELAAKMDAAMKGLRNVTITATVVGKTPEGKLMPSTFPGEIQNDRTFRISYLRLSEGVPTTGIVTADGSKLVVLGEGGLSSPRKLGSSPKRDVEKLVEEWPQSFPSKVFDTLIEGGAYWSTLVGGWQRGTQGFKLSMEERETPSRGRKVKNYRVVAERSVPGPGKRVEMVELVVDGQIFLPVTIRSHSWDARGREYQFQWSAEWKNNQKLDAAKFRIGKSVARS